MDSLMTHFVPALIVIAYYMTSNSVRPSEARGGEGGGVPWKYKPMKLKLAFQFPVPPDLSN